MDLGKTMVNGKPPAFSLHDAIGRGTIHDKPSDEWTKGKSEMTVKCVFCIVP
jgi:hypothetical protein